MAERRKRPPCTLAVLLIRTVVFRTRRGSGSEICRNPGREKVGTSRDRGGDRFLLESQGETQAEKLHKREDQKWGQMDQRAGQTNVPLPFPALLAWPPHLLGTRHPTCYPPSCSGGGGSDNQA